MNKLNDVVPNESEEVKDIRLNKDIAAFGYLWILSVVVFFARHQSKFVRYHSRQGIVLFLLSIPAAMIPFFGKFLVFFLAAGMLLGFVHAAQGQYADVPLIGELAKGDMKPVDLWKSVLSSLRKTLEFLETLGHKTAKKQGMDTPPKRPVG